MRRPPGDGFSPSRGWLVRAYTWAAHAHSGSQAHTSLGSPDPPFRGHSSFTGSLRTCSGKQQPSLPLRGPHDFPQAKLTATTGEWGEE